MRTGREVTFAVDPTDAGARLDKLVARHAGVTRSRLHLDVLRVDGADARPKDRAVAGAVVSAVLSPAQVASPAAVVDAAVAVVLEDPDFVVVDKPAGMAVHAPGGDPGRGGTLVNAVLARYPEIGALAEPDAPERPGIVHRIDRETSGLLVVARTRPGLVALRAQIADRSMHRAYAALVSGVFDVPGGVVDAPIGRDPGSATLRVREGGRHAVTSYATEASWARPSVTALTAVLGTGRTHQIRVHMQAIGHPVVGDRRYGGRMLLGATRQFLHAHRLEFRHPATGEPVSVTSPVAEDLQTVLDAAGPATTGAVPDSWTTPRRP